MSDESPADVAATNAAPPVDDTTRADASAPVGDPTAAPKPTRARKPRAPKAAAAPPAEPVVEAAPEPAAEPEPPAAKRPRRTRATKPAAPAAEEAPAPLPPVESAPAPVQTEAPAEQPAEAPAAEPKPRATRARRSTAKAKAEPEAAAPAPTPEPEPAPEPPAAAPVAEAPAEPEAKPSKPAARRRRSSSKAAAVEPEAAPEAPAPAPEVPAEPVAAAAPETEAPAPAAEEAAPARPSRRRRRGTGAKAEQPAEAPEATQPEPAAAEAPAAPTEEAAAAPAEKPGRRRSRRGRRGGEATAEAAPVVEAPVEAKPATEKPQGRRGSSRRRAAPEPEPTQPGARLTSRHGHPEIVVNGTTVPPFLFFGNLSGQKEQRRVASEVERAAKAGVHVQSTLIELVCPIPPDDTVYESTDTRLQTILEADPRALLMPRIVFVPAPGWRHQYPNEVNHYADGSTDDPSIASAMFWTDAVNALRALIEHIQRTTYGERVIGYHLERGEWFHPADMGYDRSYANREGFRQWLRTKYHNSEVALRAAWYDGAVQFYTVDIPPQPTSDRPEEAFFEPRRERRWIDFNEYTSEATANRLIELSKAVKEASSDRALVSVCYGYTFEFGHAGSGHLALAKLLAAPSIDLVCGPPSYRDRQPGTSGAFPSPMDSPAIHGKLWLSEDDTKTHLAPSQGGDDDFNPRMDSKSSTEQVHLRALGASLAHQTGTGFMDLWGEGWLDADDVWQRIGKIVERQAAYAKARKAPSPDVVVLVDERSLAHVRRGDKFMRRVLQGQREAFLRCGASVAFCLQNDVTAKAFPTDAKLYVFLNPYRLTIEQRAAIREKLQNGGKTLVWTYAVGVCAERGEPEDSPTDLVAMSLRRQPWHSEVGSKLADGRHPITDRTQERALGIRERLNPSFYVDDDAPGIVRLAEYTQTGLTSVAVREMQDWRSVFCGEPAISAELARGLCRYAGVHLYTLDTADFIYAGPGWLVHHATRDGMRTIAPPPGLSLYDIVEDRLVDDGAGAFKQSVRAKTTRCFFVGTLEEMRRLGMANLEPVRRAPVMPPPPPLPSFPAPPPLPGAEDAPSAPVDEEAGDEVEDADLLEGEELGAADETDEGAADGSEDASSPRRRRRRRGGRGRGRRKKDGEGGGEAPAAPAE